MEHSTLNRSVIGAPHWKDHPYDVVHNCDVFRGMIY
jgi:hypothetical protein